MKDSSRRHAPQAYPPASDVNCPCCQGRLVRQRRRLVDRLRSLIRPVRRYRCENFACQWMGNLAQPDAGWSDSRKTSRGNGDGGRATETSGVPASFVVHMIVVAVGVIFVVVYSTMEPATSFDEIERTLEPIVQQ